MTLTDIFCPLVEVFVLFITILAALRRNKELHQRVFVSMAIGITGVLVFLNLIYVLNQYDLSTLMERCAFVFACILIGGFTPFSLAFPNNAFQLSRRTIFLLYVPFLLLAPTSFVGNITIQRTEIIDGVLKRTEGPLYTVFGLLTLAASVTIVLVSNVKLRRETNPYYRLQIRYEIFSILIPGVFGMVSGIIMPLILGDTSLFRLGPHLAALVFVAGLFYASQSGQLMDLGAMARQIYYPDLA